MYNKNQRIAMFVNRNSYKDLPRQDMLREHIFLQILAIFVKIFSYKECVREHMFLQTLVIFVKGFSKQRMC